MRDAAGKVTRIATDTAPAHNYILGVDFQGDDIWVATAKGLSHGIRINEEIIHDHHRSTRRDFGSDHASRRSRSRTSRC